MRNTYNCLTWALHYRKRHGGRVFILRWRRWEFPHFAWRSGAPGDQLALHWHADDQDLPLWRQPLPFKGSPELVWVGEDNLGPHHFEA